MDWLFPEKGEDCVKQERIMLEGTAKVWLEIREDDNQSGVRTDDYANRISQGYNLIPLTQASIAQEKQNCK